MTRVEENDRTIRAYEMELKNVTYEEGMIKLTGAISATLFDISKSLAVIADCITEVSKPELKEEQNEQDRRRKEMTNEEAIKQQQFLIDAYKELQNIGDRAIKVGRIIKSCEMSIEALSEQRSKGEWELHGMIYYCSNCGHYCGESGDNFCGNCGADMRGNK